MKAQGQAREFINKIQRLRKDSGLKHEDQIQVYFIFSGEDADKDQALRSVLNQTTDLILGQVKNPVEEAKPGFEGEGEPDKKPQPIASN